MFSLKGKEKKVGNVNFLFFMHSEKPLQSDATQVFFIMSDKIKSIRTL